MSNQTTRETRWLYTTTSCRSWQRRQTIVGDDHDDPLQTDKGSVTSGAGNVQGFHHNHGSCRLAKDNTARKAGRRKRV